LRQELFLKLKKNYSEASVGVLWAQYGPYHFARMAAMKKQAGSLQIHPLEFSDQTLFYDWKRSSDVKPITICPGTPVEQLSFHRVFRQTRRVLAELKIDVCFMPSYAPSQSLAALMAAKSLGIRTVLMNESHSGTSQARGAAAWLKRRLVRSFDAALIGGQPQTRYLVSLGFPADKIFTGYDAVDNDYFAQRAEEIRARQEEVRGQYELPERYFLSLGRFIPKKNLTTLIRAFRIFLDSNRDTQTHLVMVGSGEELDKLTSLSKELGLPVYDKISAGMSDEKSKRDDVRPGMHFYGFRQIEENPIFYALAEAFVLPSLKEEWGLVVNEAMASGLPVIVSEPVGCAEDLLRQGWPVVTAEERDYWSRLTPGIRRNGFVFDPQSAESLAHALHALEKNPALRKVMGQASERIVDTFSCDSFARNALRALRVALGDRPTAQVLSGQELKPSVSE
jgi:glycosyltransferase involved in cell wall biosynthesis